MERWAGRVAIVTGASSGMGEGIARELAKHGMKVAALARRLEKLQKVQQDCKNFKGQIRPYKCDISNEHDICSAVKCIVSDLGPISVLINNAGLFLVGPLTDPSQGSYKKMYETNVVGLVAITQHCIESMKKANMNDGHIININSTLGHYISPAPGIANYVASKHAVTVLTESLRNELVAMKSRIKTTSISPGLVRTDMTSALIDNASVKLNALDACDIVDAVIYALSTKPHVNISELTVQAVGEDPSQLGK